MDSKGKALQAQNLFWHGIEAICDEKVCRWTVTASKPEGVSRRDADELSLWVKRHILGNYQPVIVDHTEPIKSPNGQFFFNVWITRLPQKYMLPYAQARELASEFEMGNGVIKKMVRSVKDVLDVLSAIEMMVI